MSLPSPEFWQGLETLKKACQKFGAESKVIQDSNIDGRCVFVGSFFFHWKVSPGGERCLIVFWLGASHTESSVSVALDVRVTSWTQSHKGVAQMMFLFQKGDLRFLWPLIFQSVLVFFAPLPPLINFEIWRRDTTNDGFLTRWLFIGYGTTVC